MSNFFWIEWKMHMKNVCENERGSKRHTWNLKYEKSFFINDTMNMIAKTD